MRYQQVARVATRQRMGAKLIAAGSVLEMSGVELQQRVEEELSLNPALEISDERLCPICHSYLRGSRCTVCGGVPALPREETEYPSRPEPDEPYDPFARAELPVTLSDHLRMQAHVALPRADYPLAAVLIADTNDRGLLDSSLADLALQAGASLPEITRVQAALQLLDPVGVCSSTPQEALLVQIRQLAAEQEVDPLAERIVREYWHELGRHAYSRIALDLGVTQEAVEEAVAFIVANLNPYPGNQFHPTGALLPGSPEIAVRPDVRIHAVLDEYKVEVLESSDLILRVAEPYRELRRRAQHDPGALAEWKSAVESVQRAEWFIQSLRMRRRTLRQVTECIVSLQRPFLDTGSEDRLQPMTRTKVARLMAKHESTISRAIANKFVLLPPPSNRIVPLDYFFSPGLSIKSQIEELINRESPDHPLTDQQLCQILATRGHHLARRTVAKYRLALRIPCSEQRGRR